MYRSDNGKITHEKYERRQEKKKDKQSQQEVVVVAMVVIVIVFNGNFHSETEIIQFVMTSYTRLTKTKGRIRVILSQSRLPVYEYPILIVEFGYQESL